MQMTLRVEAPHFCAGAVFQKQGNQWVCVEAAPIIAWMRKKKPRDIGAYLRYKRWKFQWINEHDHRDNDGGLREAV